MPASRGRTSTPRQRRSEIRLDQSFDRLSVTDGIDGSPIVRLLDAFAA